MHRRSLVLLSAALVLAPASLPSAAPAAPAAVSDPLVDLFGDPVVARGQGVEIRRSQVDKAFIDFKAELAVQGQRIPENLRQLHQARLLNELILKQLIHQRATPEDHAQSRDMAEQRIAELKTELGSAEAYERRLKAVGLTAPQHRQRLTEQALAETVINRELKSKQTVTEDQVRDFYENGTDLQVHAMEKALARMASDPDTTLSELAEGKEQIAKLRKANLAQLEQPEQVRVLHIYMLAKDRDTDRDLPESQLRAKRLKMDRLLARARAGEDFATLVLQNSEDRGLEQTKGEYTITRNSPLSPEFKAAAFSLSLQTNQISDVVTTPFGMHIIKLLERIPAKKPALQDVAARIKEFLTLQELQQALPDYFARLKQEAKVEILDPEYLLQSPEAGATNGAG